MIYGSLLDETDGKILFPQGNPYFFMTLNMVPSLTEQIFS